MVRPMWIISGAARSRAELVQRLLDNGLGQNHLAVISIAERHHHTMAGRPSAGHTVISASSLHNDGPAVARQIVDVIHTQGADSLLVECSEASEAKAIERIADDMQLHRLISLQSVVHAAAASSTRQVAQDTANISNSNVVWIQANHTAKPAEAQAGRGEGTRGSVRQTDPSAVLQETAKSYQRINPTVKVYDDSTFPLLLKAMRPNSLTWLWIAVLALAAAAYVLFADELAASGIPVARFTAIVVGVFLQAAPFLAIGVLLSSAIDVFVTPEWIERHLPRNPVLAQLCAVVMGFCLPACDCSAIPIFHSLVAKKVPVPVALTFMLSSPVVNPIVVFSTWYAFNGNWRVVFVRCGLGVLCALLVGATMLVRPMPIADVLKDAGAAAMHHHGNAPGDARTTVAAVRAADHGGSPTDRDQARRGEEAAHDHNDHREVMRAWGGRPMAVVRQARYEFFDVGRYLLFGILVSGVLQIVLPSQRNVLNGLPMLVSLGALMLLAFLLSLCSSADAVVARSMLTVAPLGALIGFLVYGPMMDIKNVSMLSAGFSKGFVMRLLVTTTVVCFAVVAAFLLIVGKGALII